VRHDGEGGCDDIITGPSSSAGVRPVAEMPPARERNSGRRGLSTGAGFRRRTAKLMVSTVPDIAIIDGPGYQSVLWRGDKVCAGSLCIECDTASTKVRWDWEPMRSELVGREVPNW